jgi:hypothetical protein
MRYRIALAALLAGLLLAGIGCSGGDRAVTDGTAATTLDKPIDETFPDETTAPASTKPETARKKVGDTGTLYDADTGQHLATVQVTKIRWDDGDIYNRPERGNFLGVYVRVKALADEQSSLWGDFYVLVRGHHYDGDACCPDGFEPSLGYVDLNKGETTEGWLIFDVPARHGQVVLGDSFGEGGPIATWSF